MNDATTWIDPELVAAGKLLQSRGLVAPDRTQAPLSEVRAAVDRIGAFLGEGSVPLARERDLALPGPHGQVPCRLYLPDGIEAPPLIVYAHGGGFVQGSLPSWDAMLRDLVRQSGVAALSVVRRGSWAARGSGRQPKITVNAVAHHDTRNFPLRRASLYCTGELFAHPIELTPTTAGR